MRRIRRLEKSIEKAIIRYYKRLLIKYLGDPKAEKDGPLKLNTAGRRAFPDRLFFGPYGRIRMIEFKRLGKDATPLQAHVHWKLSRLQHHVDVVDNVEEGKRIVDWLFRPREQWEPKPAPVGLAPKIPEGRKKRGQYELHDYNVRGEEVIR
jgi:hypothetical protein